MPEDIIVKLSESTTIPGRHPVVVIGPNGSGKTRFGVDLAHRNNAEFIGALRNITLDENISMQGLAQATKGLTSQIKSYRSRYWQMSNEINLLFTKLLAEDATSAVRFRDQHAVGATAQVEETNLMRLRKAWADFFPGRNIDFSSYKPTVVSGFDSSGTPYSASRMSDGERVALYLGGRILNSQSNIVVIDEPEVHFHSRLAVRFWNTLEQFRPDIRFIYITHDLTFALSRQSAQFVIVKPNTEPSIIPLDGELPRSLSESILGAASFSIYAKRIIFCEGQEGEGGDHSFYSSWFKGFDTTVIPVGSCKDVVQCTQAFGNDKLVAGVSAIGIVDRDYWPEQYVKSLPTSVYVLPVHEIENLFCFSEVFEAVGRHLSIDSAEITERYKKFMSQAKALFKQDLLAKQISERFKRRCVGGLTTVVNNLRAIEDVDVLQTEHVRALQPDNWSFDPENIFREERVRLDQALASDDEATFLQLFPGKVFFPLAAKALGIDPIRYRELVGSALQVDDSNPLTDLRAALETKLSAILPSRK